MTPHCLLTPQQQESWEAGQLDYASDAELAPDASLIGSIMADPEAAMGLQRRSSALAKAQITQALSPEKLAQAEEQVQSCCQPVVRRAGVLH